MKMNFKVTVASIFWISVANLVYGQQLDTQTIMGKLELIENQFGDAFDENEYEEKLTLIITENDDMTFRGIYMKFKEMEFKQNVTFVSGYQNLLKGSSPKILRNHLQEGLSSDQALGKGSFSIWLDMNSEIIKLLHLNQYSIVTINRKNHQFQIMDYGSDRAMYISEIKKHLK